MVVNLRVTLRVNLRVVFSWLMICQVRFAPCVCPTLQAFEELHGGFVSGAGVTLWKKVIGNLAAQLAAGTVVEKRIFVERRYRNHGSTLT